MEAVFTFIAERWPSIAAVLIAVALTIVVCKWYFGRFVPTERKADDNQKRFDNLPCQRHEDEISSIRAYLLVKYPKAFGTYAQKKSPKTLNEEGKRLFDDIGGAAFLEANGEWLMAMIAEMKPKTPLDVELLSLDALYRSMKDDMFNGMKRWVYDSPARKMTVNGVEKEYEVTLADVCFVLSIPLRDMYLSLHPDLK